MTLGGGGGNSSRSYPDLVVVVTGTGPQRAEYELKIGLGRYCPPRHPTNFQPSFLELNSIL